MHIKQQARINRNVQLPRGCPWNNTWILPADRIHFSVSRPRRSNFSSRWWRSATVLILDCLCWFLLEQKINAGSQLLPLTAAFNLSPTWPLNFNAAPDIGSAATLWPLVTRCTASGHLRPSVIAIQLLKCIELNLILLCRFTLQAPAFDRTCRRTRHSHHSSSRNCVRDET